MTEPARAPRRSRAAASFRPGFTLILIYFFAFFLFFALLLALPDLLEGMRTLPPAPTPEQERALGAEIARKAVAGKLLYAFLAATIACGIGGYARVLPGLRERR